MFNTAFDFENDAHWKSMAGDMQQLIIPWNYSIALQPSTYDGLVIAEEIEKVLKDKVSNYRMGMNKFRNRSFVTSIDKLR